MAMITMPIPDVNGAKSIEQKIEILLDSYFMLRKEIEYSLHNIGFENFDKDFEVRLYDDREKISNLISTNEVFLSRIEDAEGNISILEQTSNSISSTVISHTQTIDGMQINISQIEQTATQISSTVAQHTLDINGLSTDYSSIVQTVNSISSTVSSHTGSISTLQQTANSLTSRVSSAEGNISTIRQTSDAIALAVNNSKLTFNSSGLTVKNGGLFLTTNGDYEVFKADTGGRVLSRGLYILNPYSVSGSGSLYYTQRTILAATSGLNGQVLIGYNKYERYLFSEGGTYKHLFRGSMDLGSSSDTIRIKGFAVAFDANGFLKKA